MGMRVIAIDGGDAKRDLCLSLGAEKFIDFTTTKDITSEIIVRLSMYELYVRPTLTSYLYFCRRSPRMAHRE
jgi:D-arabinose 1-dehydrogenase-like Zn-dependent alcohol dehydrogenase